MRSSPFLTKTCIHVNEKLIYLITACEHMKLTANYYVGRISYHSECVALSSTISPIVSPKDGDKNQGVTFDQAAL